MKSNDQSSRISFTFSKIRPLQGAVLFAMSLAFACAGKTGETTGPLSTCGSSCTTDQVNASCSSTCNKLLQLPCYTNRVEDVARCTQDCAKFGSAANCPKAREFLQCIESTTPTCVGNEPDFGPTCNPISKEANECDHLSDSPPVMGTGTGTGTGTAGGYPVPVPVDDPAVCPNIPRSVVGPAGACVGSGSAPAGPDAALECTSSCQDGAGNLWEAACNGTTCSCSYNRTQMCTCTITSTVGGCPSCCPGTHSP